MNATLRAAPGSVPPLRPLYVSWREGINLRACGRISTNGELGGALLTCARDSPGHPPTPRSSSSSSLEMADADTIRSAANEAAPPFSATGIRPANKKRIVAYDESLRFGGVQLVQLTSHSLLECYGTLRFVLLRLRSLQRKNNGLGAGCIDPCQLVCVVSHSTFS